MTDNAVANISPDLQSKLDDDRRQTIQTILRKLSHEYPQADIQVVDESDRPANPQEKLVVEVTADIHSLDQYDEMKSTIRRIARDAENDDAMVYTRLDRK